jgi:hypothetical protein
VASDAAKSGNPVSVGAAAQLTELAGAQDVELGDEVACDKLKKDAARWQVIFGKLDKLARGDQKARAAVVRFVDHWQRGLLRPSPGEDVRRHVYLPFENALHHQVLDRLVRCRRTNWHGRRCLPDTYWIPCKSCGCIIETTAPRFGRTCPACQHAPAYHQRLGVHKTGALPVYTGGLYSNGPNRRAYVWPTVCEHPDCVSLLLAANRDQKYCPEHTRLSALRARERDSRPKNERFRFFPNYEVFAEGGEVREEFTIRGERRVCVIGPNGYQARDVEELRPLIARATATDWLRIVRGR